jgi:outer membrane protein assembly factor BamD
MQRLLSPVVVRALGVALAALALSSCGLFPEVKDETAGWSADRLYQTAHEAMMQGNYSRATKLFDQLEARYPVWPLRAAGDPRVGVRELARQRAGGGHRRGRPLHPHVSQSSERRLRVLPQGPRALPRGPGPHRLRLRARPVRARSEGDALVVRAFKELHAKFPDSQYYQDSIARMRYLNNAMATYEVKVASYYYSAARTSRPPTGSQGALVKIPADAFPTGESARPPARELHASWHATLADDTPADPRPHLSRQPLSHGARATSPWVAGSGRSKGSVRRAGDRLSWPSGRGGIW